MSEQEPSGGLTNAAPIGVRAAASAVPAALGASIGGVPGAVVGAVASEYIVRVAEKAWGELRAARQQSVTQMLVAAAEDLDQAPEELVDYAFVLDGGPDLLNDALLAASDSINQRKVRALGRALANGLRDDGALIDENRLLVFALAQLEEPHIKLLAIVEPSPQWTDLKAIIERVEHSLAILPVLERAGLIENNDDDYLQVVGEFYAELSKYQFAKEVAERYGSIEGEPVPSEPSDDPMTYFASGYQRTQFGSRCLEYLEAESGH
ncbi:hypothetical protein [Nocardioides caldifontis]|uniref:hypothetical protein n=1 Tax=Nocardioides caldifontis TaxID=2588938 RepID=UPI0011DFB3B5|nr:hypothetical protein [Nocardioides caldifontis]